MSINSIAFEIYPVPVSNDILNVSAEKAINSVEIFNIIGHRVLTKELSGLDRQVEINVSLLEKGMYVIRISNSEKEYVALEQQASSTGTLVINLPIVEQNAPTSTSTPIGGYPGPIQATPSETFTPTPTPIPIQTGSTNVPIVLGVIGIIFVILIAWLFFGYLPQRSKG